MESYGRFAGVYDVFMDNVNYREWADYIIETLAQDGIRDGLVLELGCGTGTGFHVVWLHILEKYFP